METVFRKINLVKIKMPLFQAHCPTYKWILLIHPTEYVITVCTLKVHFIVNILADPSEYHHTKTQVSYVSEFYIYNKNGIILPLVLKMFKNILYFSTICFITLIFQIKYKLNEINLYFTHFITSYFS